MHAGIYIYIRICIYAFMPANQQISVQSCARNLALCVVTGQEFPDSAMSATLLPFEMHVLHKASR